MFNLLKSRARFGAGSLSLLVSVLALGCSTAKMPAAGQLEIVATESGSAFDSPTKGTFVGSLELRGLRDEALASIPIKGLSSGSTLRRELPAGLYTMAYTIDEGDAGEAGTSRMARDLPLVGIIAGQVTRLIVQPPEACSDAPPPEAFDAERLGSTCNTDRI